jgi:uncharacterized protein (TIGR02145 family)
MPPTRLTLILALLLTHAAAQPATPLQYSGKTYKTVKIGEQTWMAENLNYEAEGSRCNDDNPDNCAKYGRLYNWETAMKVCPKGWHLPSNAEWEKLFRFVDGDTGTKSPYDSKTAGKYLKARSGWKKGGNGTDKYGFAALPGADCLICVSHVIWWTASAKDSSFIYSRFMSYSDIADWSIYDNSFMSYVRCIQD